MTTRKSVSVLFVGLALATAGSASLSFAAALPTMPPTGYDKGGKYPAGKVQDVNYQSPVTNSTRKMVVYTPPGYDPSKKYPVLYGVHGIGAWPSTIFDDWCCGGAFVSDNLLGEKKIEPIIMVAMDNNNVDSHRELFEAIMPYVEAHYPVIADADHRAIYGYSLGGGVTFAEGLGHIDTFHHICPTSAANFNHPADAAMFPNGGAEVKEKVKTLFISCGDADWDGFYPPNLATHNYCATNGIPHTWLSVPGGGHDGGVWRPAMWNCLQLAFPATTDGTSGAGGSTGAGGSAGGGVSGAGGKTGAGGAGVGGSTGTGGVAAGGATGTGGSAPGGVTGTGGGIGSGGRTSAGGASGTGGATSAGGGAGSSSASGGAIGTGGAKQSGGANGHGGSSATPAPGSEGGCTCGMGRRANGAPSASLIVVLGALLSARLWRRSRPVRRSSQS
jgi:enterochelin esterase-like enzyme